MHLTRSSLVSLFSALMLGATACGGGSSSSTGTGGTGGASPTTSTTTTASASASGTGGVNLTTSSSGSTTGTGGAGTGGMTSSSNAGTGGAGTGGMTSSSSAGTGGATSSSGTGGATSSSSAASSSNAASSTSAASSSSGSSSSSTSSSSSSTSSSSSSSTSSSSSSSTSSSSSSSSGGMMCVTAAGCPPPASQCVIATCTAGVCGTAFAAPSTACNQGGGSTCDGMGNCVSAPAVASTTPADATMATAATTVVITFTMAMNPTTLTAQTAAGACSGAIQVSLDGFASCVAFSSATAVMSDGNTTATLTAAPGLLVNRVYKIRVTTAAHSSGGVALGAQFTQPTGFTTTSPNLCDGSLVISQVYGGGGNTGAIYDHDFVELHNRGTTAVSLAGLSLQYGPATAMTWNGVVPLSGAIPAGGYFLVSLVSGGANGAPLPAPDLSNTTVNLSATNGKIALINGITAVPAGNCPPPAQTLDLVGYGTANCGLPLAPLSNTTAAARLQSGCADVARNAADFMVAQPLPRNSATAASACACLVENESNSALEADFCDTQFPLSLTAQTGTATMTVYGQIYEAGVTDPAGPSLSIRAQLGFGPTTANPEYEPGWTWINAPYNVQSGNNDEYQASFTAPAVGTYNYVYRFSLDQGVSWTFCDNAQGDGGAGSNAGLTFDFQDEGILTVTP